MKKVLGIAIIWIYAILLAAEDEAETKLVPLKQIVTEKNIHTVEKFLVDGAILHSWSIQVADMCLYPFPVSAHPHLYRITIPATKDTPSHYFYSLFSHHTFPIELVMPRGMLNKLMDECRFVVGETTGERGKNLSRKTLEKYGLLLDDSTHAQLIDAQRQLINKSINEVLGDAPSSVCELMLSPYKEWLENWYSAIPEFLRDHLENNKDLLVDPALLKEMHPFWVMNKIINDLSPDTIMDKKAQKFGMDNAIENLCKDKGKQYLGLETLRDCLDAGELQELREDVKDFMSTFGSISSLQAMVTRIPKEVSEMPVDVNPNQRPYWATYETTFIDVKLKREADIRNYFYGKFPSDKPSKSAIKRTKNWKPQIMELTINQLNPWLLNVGLKHGIGVYGLLHWFRNEGFVIERFSN